MWVVKVKLATVILRGIEKLNEVSIASPSLGLLNGLSTILVCTWIIVVDCVRRKSTAPWLSFWTVIMLGSLSVCSLFFPRIFLSNKSVLLKILAGKNNSLWLNALFREKSGLDNSKQEPERTLKKKPSLYHKIPSDVLCRKRIGLFWTYSILMSFTSPL